MAPRGKRHEHVLGFANEQLARSVPTPKQEHGQRGHGAGIVHEKASHRAHLVVVHEPPMVEVLLVPIHRAGVWCDLAMALWSGHPHITYHHSRKHRTHNTWYTPW